MIEVTPPGVLRQARFARLEYGKWCQWDDGPIIPVTEGTDHGYLGRSSGFPKNVADMCDPEGVWFSHAGLERFAAGCPHATVWRPVRDGDHLRHVLTRVALRPEDGAFTDSRNYFVARFLLGPAEGASPEDMLAAMEAEPIIGLSKEHVARGLPELSGAGIVTSSWPAPPSTFLQPALECALAVVPIVIGTRIEEGEFFAMVAALWRALPQHLRGLLSAGWGVGASLTDQLNLSYGEGSSDLCAIYMPAEGRWVPPARFLLASARAKSTGIFGPALMAPARLCAENLACSGASDAPPEPARISAAFPSIPGLTDWQVIEAFRDYVRKGADSLLLRRLREWLSLPGANEISATATGFILDENWRLAGQLAIDALQSPELRARGDRFLTWALLTPAAGAVRRLCEMWDGPFANRVKLLASATKDDFAPGIVAAFADAVRGREHDELPEAILRRVQKALDATIESPDSPVRQAHAQLLNDDLALPDTYTKWVGVNGDMLAVWLAHGGRENDKAVQRLAGVAPSPLISTVQRWCSWLPLQEAGLQTLNALPLELQSIFADAVRDTWNDLTGSPSERRQAIVSWARLIPERHEDALLRLLRMGPPALETPSRDKDVICLNRDVARGLVPEAAEMVLAEAALTYWNDFSSFVASSDWNRITRHWPRKPALALLKPLKCASNADPSVAHLPAELANGLCLKQGILENCLQFWLSVSKSHPTQFDELADLFLVWMDNCIPEQAAALGVIDVWRSYLQDPADRRTADDTTIDLSIRFFQGAGLMPEIESRIDELWTTALTPWRILLLLNMFPERDLRPSLDQLGALVPERRRVRAHLTKDVHQRRAGLFEVAKTDFHGLIYGSKSHRRFCGILPGPASVLWAAFRGVPPDLHGDLGQALETYGADRVARVGLCRHYISLNGDQSKAAVRVLDYLLGLLREDGFPREEVHTLMKAMRPNVRRARWRKILGGNNGHILLDADAWRSARILTSREICVAVWFHEILKFTLKYLNDVMVESTFEEFFARRAASR